jgi:hypothetical protein
VYGLVLSFDFLIIVGPPTSPEERRRYRDEGGVRDEFWWSCSEEEGLRMEGISGAMEGWSGMGRESMEDYTPPRPHISPSVRARSTTRRDEEGRNKSLSRRNEEERNRSLSRRNEEDRNRSLSPSSMSDVQSSLQSSVSWSAEYPGETTPSRSTHRRLLDLDVSLRSLDIETVDVVPDEDLELRVDHFLRKCADMLREDEEQPLGDRASIRKVGRSPRVTVSTPLSELQANEKRMKELAEELQLSMSFGSDFKAPGLLSPSYFLTENGDTSGRWIEGSNDETKTLERKIEEWKTNKYSLLASPESHASSVDCSTAGVLSPAIVTFDEEDSSESVVQRLRARLGLTDLSIDPPSEVTPPFERKNEATTRTHELNPSAYAFEFAQFAGSNWHVPWGLWISFSVCSMM